jgi:hypothetical protein
MGENANSYVDLTYADSYFENHFNSLKSTNWSNLSDEQKSQLLVMACWDIEQLRFVATTNTDKSAVQGQLHWDSRQGRFTAYVTPSKSPVPYNAYQALQFPRNYDYKSDGSVFIPERVKMAQCEQAIYLYSLDETAMANRLQGIFLDRVNLGGISVSQEYAYQGVSIAPMVYEWLKPFLFRSGRIGRA